MYFEKAPYTNSCKWDFHCRLNTPGSLRSRPGVLKLLNVLDDLEDPHLGKECHVSKAGGSITKAERRDGKERRTEKESLASPLSTNAEEQLTRFHFLFSSIDFTLWNEITSGHIFKLNQTSAFRRVTVWLYPQVSRPIFSKHKGSREFYQQRPFCEKC